MEGQDPVYMTAAASSEAFPMYVGYIGCAVAVFFFGSNWVPIKKFETGDGE